MKLVDFVIHGTDQYGSPVQELLPRVPVYTWYERAWRWIKRRFTRSKWKTVTSIVISD